MGSIHEATHRKSRTRSTITRDRVDSRWHSPSIGGQWFHTGVGYIHLEPGRP
ncbi:hypothetical protein AZE42_06701 [Rhizopogon vesiculosus]|uniref:Uncharacterized protein n=1 Tax=Rhizopogon vesiculosus TaxID=180088 RepID=A0A1J8QRK2_9AGAM|nr:hypothetical protein AZE42_06701 [Rhizopogon vesiculosus]